jgi:hypothetical protein
MGPAMLKVVILDSLRATAKHTGSHRLFALIMEYQLFACRRDM